MSRTSNRHQTSPGAVKALRGCFAKMSAPAIDIPTLVRKLDEAGFCIVEKFGTLKAPAGRGNETYKRVRAERTRAQREAALARRGMGEPSVYTGPDLIGRSHSANLLNGGIS